MTPERLKEISDKLACQCEKHGDTISASTGKKWYNACPKHGESGIATTPNHVVAELIAGVYQIETWGIDCQWGCDAGAHASGCPLKYPGNYASKEALDKALEIVIANLHRDRERKGGKS